MGTDHSREYRAFDLMCTNRIYEFELMLPTLEQGVYNRFDHTFERGIDGLNYISCAAEKGLCDAIRVLVLHGVDVDLTNIYEETPLMTALVFGQLQAARLLLDFGADPTKKDYTGKGMKEHAEYGAAIHNDLGIIDWAYANGILI